MEEIVRVQVHIHDLPDPSPVADDKLVDHHHREEHVEDVVVVQTWLQYSEKIPGEINLEYNNIVTV